MNKIIGRNLKALFKGSLHRIILISVLLVVAILLLLVKNEFSTSSVNFSDPDIMRIKTAGVLVVGTDAVYPPMEYLNHNGEVIGFGMDIAHLIASSLNVDLEIRNIPWSELFDALEQGDVDIVISSVTITEERSKKYGFSNPYFFSGQAIIVRQQDEQILLPQDLEGKKVAAHQDTTGYQEAVKYAQDENLVYPYEGEDTDSIRMLQAGEIDAVIMDFPAAVQTTKSYEGIKVLPEPFTSEFYGVVLKKDDGFVRHINQVISNLKKSGKLKQLEDKWL